MPAFLPFQDDQDSHADDEGIDMMDWEAAPCHTLAQPSETPGVFAAASRGLYSNPLVAMPSQTTNTPWAEFSTPPMPMPSELPMM
jgi:hypothetical protein